MTVRFDPSILTEEDAGIVKTVLGVPAHIPNYNIRKPDLVITPHDKPYIFRWHLVKQEYCRVYLHVQVSSDLGRDLHDHAYDNTSVILAGGYDETYNILPRDTAFTQTRKLRKGHVVHRKAETAHRLDLPDDIPYAISLFTTGPSRRDWGFWRDCQFTSHEKVIQEINGVSRHREEQR